MKTIYLICALFIGSTISFLHAQTAEEIINNYIENIGGQEAWSKVENLKMIGVGRQQGVDYPFEAYYMKDGRYVIDVDLQGASFIVEAFDGENAWAMNFQTQKAEASDSETSSNIKKEAADEINSPFFNYKEKGYTVELLGKDTYEGSEVYKIKLTKQPVTVDGKEEENIDIFYFDIDNFVPIAMEDKETSGPAKGATMVREFSDYQEIEGGLYIPFTQIDKFNGNPVIEVIIKEVEVNAKVDESIFKMPED